VKGISQKCKQMQTQRTGKGKEKKTRRIRRGKRVRLKECSYIKGTPCHTWCLLFHSPIL
jgi:hypothetical protein